MHYRSHCVWANVMGGKSNSHVEKSSFPLAAGAETLFELNERPMTGALYSTLDRRTTQLEVAFDI